MRRVLGLVAILGAGCGHGNAGTGADAGAPGGDVAAACVTAESCGLDPSGSGGASGCTVVVAGVNLPSYARRASIDSNTVDCLARAGADCDAARRCLNGGQTPGICMQFEQRSCDGTVLVTCTDATGTMGNLGTARFDCASGGEQCVAIPDGGVGCGAAPCSGGASRCNGASVETCDQGILHDLDCSAVGAGCIVAAGVPRCHGTGPSCSTSMLDPGQPLRCEGTVLVACYDGQEARFDCASIGAGCFALPSPSARPFGCALGVECDPASFSSTCAGNVLAVCDQGRIAHVDCAAAGFKSCDPNFGRCLN